MDFDVASYLPPTFLRLLERLLDAESYSSDAYGAYGCLPVFTELTQRSYTIK